MLNKKRIILIGPSNYDYPLIIKSEIELDGGIVHFYDERNNATSMDKILIRKVPGVIKKRIEQYYCFIAEREYKFNPNFVLFISPETVTVDAVKNLRKSFKNAKFVLYMWDSIENKNAKKIYKEFDKCLSFDPGDCKKYGFIFRPLFFSREYENMYGEIRGYRYDFGFVGTAHSDRAEILYKLKRYCDLNDMKYYFYLYIPGKIMFLYRYIQNRYVRKLYKQGIVHINTLDHTTVEHIMVNTRYVIDVNHPDQRGLTMRTIEMLGLKRKLLTTNASIKDYDFYREGNQIIINRKSINIDKSIIVREYEDIPEKIYLKYRIDRWVKDIFEGI